MILRGVAKNSPGLSRTLSVPRSLDPDRDKNFELAVISLIAFARLLRSVLSHCPCVVFRRKRAIFGYATGIVCNLDSGN